MFKKLRQKIEESDTVKKANDSLLGKYLTPGHQQHHLDAAGGADSASSSTASGAIGSGRYGPAGAKSRSRQSSIGSAFSEASSSVAAAGAEVAQSNASPTTQLELLSRPELAQRLLHAQSLARRYKARLFDADNRLRASGDSLAWLAARDRLIEALKLQSSLLAEGRPVPAELAAEIIQAESEVSATDSAAAAADGVFSAEPAATDEDSGRRQNGEGLANAFGESQEEKQRQRILQLESQVEQMKRQLAATKAELEKQRQQVQRLQKEATGAVSANSSGSPSDSTAALESRLRDAEAKLAAVEQRHRDERAIAAEEAAAGRRRLKQQLAELQQQLAAREREAALKDSTGATRESEIRTLKERLDSRLASERRLREESKARSAEAASLAEQLRGSRLESEDLARQCRELQRQLEVGLAGRLEQLESEHADKLKTAAREFQDRLEAKEREFQAKFQEAVDRFQEAESRARTAHRLETDELLQGLEAREVAEGRLNRRLEAAESERAAALADLVACQAVAAEEAERLRAEAADAQAGRLAAEAAVEELRAQLEAASESTALASAGPYRCQSDALALLCRIQEAVRAAAATSDAPSSSSARTLLNSLADQVEHARAAAVTGRHLGDSVSLEDYEAVKMYAADLQTQLMSVNSELAELRARKPQPRAAPVSREPQPGLRQTPSQSAVAFTEIPEVEYLRNVLYKYMLGEKTQTLARVICTVLKFTDYQIQQVMDHEGRRAAAWLVTQ